MAEHFFISVPGRPVPKERPRVGKYGNIYTPQKTADFEKHIAALWTEKYPNTTFDGELHVSITFYTDRAHKQDIDNLTKSVLDGLQRASAFAKGDEQVFLLIADKIPSKYPKTEIQIYPIQIENY